VGTIQVVSGAAASPGLVFDVARLRSGNSRDKDDPVVLRLKALSEEAAQLASALATDPPAAAAGRGGRKGRANSPEEALRLLVEIRRMRFRQFESDLSANPGWDLLLDLMSAHLAGRQVPVSSACVAAGVPATTALRLVNGLVEAGFIRRRPDPNDGRRVLVDLTEDGRRRMDVFLRSVARLIG
jgi:DNA-binding MarR family transcriptional regulator